MNRLLVIGAAFAVLIEPAMAAEKPRPIRERAQPAVVTVHVHNWNGFYVGGNIGGSWGNAETDLAGTGNFRTPVAPTVFGFANSNTAWLNGVNGGGQVGYNYQFHPRWLLGFEADIQASSERGSNVSTNQFAIPSCIAGNGTNCGFFGRPLPATAQTATQAKIDSFGTVRGRLGFLIDEELLLYGTAGLAYGRITVSGSTSVNTSFGLAEFGGGPIIANAIVGNSKTSAGFSVGAGAEGRFSSWLSSSWTWKVEYLCLDLGSLNAELTFVGAPRPTVGFLGMSGIVTTHSHITANILRLGLNYKFGS